jgi:hypothetical protein
MKCKICGGEAQKIFTKKILHKYDVGYYRCGNCMFMQTEDPFWLSEAYNSAINFSDVGLVTRNNVFVENMTALFTLCKFDRNKRYLDYGGGYGLFVRLMRDNGYNFYWSDEYCENIYAKKFTTDDLSPTEQNFEVVTAFEVFEHLADPIKELEKLLTYSDSVLFSTELVKDNIPDISNWWYIAAEHGQHLAFYHRRTLEFIARKFDLNLYTNKNLHFLTKKKLSSSKYKLGTTYKFARIYNTLISPKSLLQADYEMYLKEQ